jgi:hypothetical protein
MYITVLLCSKSSPSFTHTSHNVPTPSLPTELWLSIIFYVDDPKYMLRKCRLVSRTFNSCVKTCFYTHFIPQGTRIEYAAITLTNECIAIPCDRIGAFSHYSADEKFACFRLSSIQTVGNLVLQLRGPWLSILFAGNAEQEKSRVLWTYPSLDFLRGGSYRLVTSRWIFDEEQELVEVECQFPLEIFMS